MRTGLIENTLVAMLFLYSFSISQKIDVGSGTTMHCCPGYKIERYIDIYLSNNESFKYYGLPSGFEINLKYYRTDFKRYLLTWTPNENQIGEHVIAFNLEKDGNVLDIETIKILVSGDSEKDCESIQLLTTNEFKFIGKRAHWKYDRCFKSAIIEWDDGNTELIDYSSDYVDEEFYHIYDSPGEYYPKVAVKRCEGGFWTNTDPTGCATTTEEYNLEKVSIKPSGWCGEQIGFCGHRGYWNAESHMFYDYKFCGYEINWGDGYVDKYYIQNELVDGLCESYDNENVFVGKEFTHTYSEPGVYYPYVEVIRSEDGFWTNVDPTGPGTTRDRNNIGKVVVKEQYKCGTRFEFHGKRADWSSDRNLLGFTIDWGDGYQDEYIYPNNNVDIEEDYLTKFIHYYYTPGTYYPTVTLKRCEGGFWTNIDPTGCGSTTETVDLGKVEVNWTRYPNTANVTPINLLLLD